MHRGHRIFLPTWGLLLFVVGLTGALLAGLAALILWVATHIGLIGAAMAVCLLCILLAWCSYLFSLRAALRRIAESLESVRYASLLIERAYAWLGGKESLVLKLFDRLLDRWFPVK